MRISDWSSDVCSSDLLQTLGPCVFDKQLANCFTAHPKKDAKTGELHFFGYGTPDPLSAGMVYGVVDAANTVIRMESFQADRKHVVWGTSVSVRVSLGGRHSLKKTKRNYIG